MNERMKKIKFVVNPISGTQSKELILNLLDEKIDKARYSWEVVNTERAGHAVEIAALLTNTFVPMVRRKEVADSRLSPGSKCRAERNRTGHRNCHPCRMGKVFRRGYHPQGWSPHRLGLPLLYPASEGAAAEAGDSRR